MLRLLAACALMAACVSIHASGLAWALGWLRKAGATPLRFAPSLRLFVRMAIWIVVLHIVEIIAWALLFTWRGALPDFSTAVYFSAVTYTTTGYGDVTLPERWRLSSAVEALTGILMCGWSTGFFFAIVSRINERTGKVSA